MLSHHHTRSQFVPRLLLLLILCLSIFPSISPSKLSSFYSLISSLATKPKPAGVKIKRSSLFWEISPASPIDPILESVDLENRSESGKIPQFVTSPIAALEKKVESLTFFQSLLQSIAASKVREDLALVSSHWANTARSVVASKYGQVIHLTRKVHEAQILSLQRASTAQLLDDALSKAAAVHYSSLTRYAHLFLIKHVRMRVCSYVRYSSCLVGRGGRVINSECFFKSYT